MSEKTLGQQVEENLAGRGISRRNLFKGGAALGLAGMLAACGGDDDEGGGEDPADIPEDSPLRGTLGDEMQGKHIEMGLAALSGWPPSQIPVDLYPDFSAYTEENFGYTTSVTKTEAPFAELFQKIAPSLAAGSQEYNIMVSDSQWLGALSEPGWIVSADTIMGLNPELDIEVYSSLVVNTYQVYPDGSGQRWGFPQMPDTQGIFMRLDWLEDPDEQAAFEAAYGYKLPTTFDEYEQLKMTEYEDIFEFFTRPDEGIYGLAAQYS